MRWGLVASKVSAGGVVVHVPSLAGWRSVERSLCH